MTSPDVDRTATRREIADVLVKALERRHEVLDAIVESADRAEANAAVRALLDTDEAAADAVLGLQFTRLTKVERRKIAKELADADATLTFVLAERPAATGTDVQLRAFDAVADRELFAVRTSELHVAGDGSGAPAGDVDDEIAAAIRRIVDDEAAWLVAVDASADANVGLVFGELANGEIDLRVWIAPEHRKRGYATAAMRRARREIAGLFPGVPMVIRAPGV